MKRSLILQRDFKMKAMYLNSYHSNVEIMGIQTNYRFKFAREFPCNSHVILKMLLSLSYLKPKIIQYKVLTVLMITSQIIYECYVNYNHGVYCHWCHHYILNIRDVISSFLRGNHGENSCLIEINCNKIWCFIPKIVQCKILCQNHKGVFFLCIKFMLIWKIIIINKFHIEG